MIVKPPVKAFVLPTARNVTSPEPLLTVSERLFATASASIAVFVPRVIAPLSADVSMVMFPARSTPPALAPVPPVILTLAAVMLPSRVDSAVPVLTVKAPSRVTEPTVSSVSA